MIDELGVLCNILQIIGLILIIAQRVLPIWAEIFIALSGFAAIVKAFLPIPEGGELSTYFAASCGLGIIVASCVWVVKRANAMKEV